MLGAGGQVEGIVPVAAVRVGRIGNRIGHLHVYAPDRVNERDEGLKVEQDCVLDRDAECGGDGLASQRQTTRPILLAPGIGGVDARLPVAGDLDVEVAGNGEEHRAPGIRIEVKQEQRVGVIGAAVGTAPVGAEQKHRHCLRRHVKLW